MIGNTVRGTDSIVQSSGIVPGRQDPVPIRSSLMTYTDSNTNLLASVVTSDILRESVLNGSAYGAMYGQTIGGAAQGQYCLSVFNPVGSGKNVFIASIKTMVNYSLTTTWLYLNTADPAYNTNLSSSILNMKGSGSASVLGSHVTANSASVSFPGSGNIEQAMSAPEMISNSMGYLLPPGNGLNTLVFVGNSQQYASAVKWIEF